ncbi:MAG: hypothetical protein Q4A06_00695 [Cardiobacteriaceae bacterium]|nr:hypothetical protein [Cardiobacteriaceae bacterium]
MFAIILKLIDLSSPKGWAEHIDRRRKFYNDLAIFKLTNLLMEGKISAYIFNEFESLLKSNKISFLYSVRLKEVFVDVYLGTIGWLGVMTAILIITSIFSFDLYRRTFLNTSPLSILDFSLVIFDILFVFCFIVFFVFYMRNLSNIAIMERFSLMLDELEPDNPLRNLFVKKEGKENKDKIFLNVSEEDIAQFLENRAEELTRNT